MSVVIPPTVPNQTSWLAMYGNHLFDQGGEHRCYRCNHPVQIHDGRICLHCRIDCVTGEPVDADRMRTLLEVRGPYGAITV
jgi:hypothetical protein